MIDALLQGLAMVIQWPAIGYLFIGVASGLLIGVIPGLGGGIGIILLLPFTFGLDTISAFALLLGMYAVTCTSDTVASIMLGVPGTAASQATILDGYPLAQQGQAQRAFGAAFTVSAMGGVFGAAVMCLSLPILHPVVKTFMNPEIFLLAVLGLSMVGSLSGSSPWKGIAVAAFGILLGMVGYSESGAVPRFYMGFDYLLDGMPLLPLVLGLFAIPELLDLAVRNVSIADKGENTSSNYTLLFQGVKEAFQNWWLALRCAVLGTYIGILPGLGGSIVDWVAYGHAVQTSKKDPKFGHGDIRGVIAPEAANNAMRGGGLIPTVTFGVPGTTGYAILLSALLVKGLQPGPLMLTRQLPLTMSLIWTLVLANVIAAVAMLFLSNKLSKVAFIPGRLLVPGVMLFVFMGAWTETSSWGDWIMLLIISFIGFSMKRGDWPRPPLILGFILGSLMENSFLISIRAYEPNEMFSRITVLILIALIFLTIVVSIKQQRQKNRKKTEGKDETPKGDPEVWLYSISIGVTMFVIFVLAFWHCYSWDFPVRIFPQSAAIPGIILSALAIRQIWRDSGDGGIARRFTAEQKADFLGALCFLGFLLAALVGSFILGQKLALIAFVIVFLRSWTDRSWRFCLGYGALGWAVLALFYDRLLTVFWEPSLFGDLIMDTTGKGWPSWILF